MHITVFELMHLAAPAFLAVSSFASSTSIPITRAPRNAAPATAPSPTPPHPNTATVSSARHAPAPDCMEAHRQRLNQAQLLQRKFAVIQLRRRHRDELRQRSISLHTNVWLSLHAFGRPRLHAAQRPHPVYGDNVTAVPTSHSLCDPGVHYRRRNLMSRYPRITHQRISARDTNSDRFRIIPPSHLQQNFVFTQSAAPHTSLTTALSRRLPAQLTFIQTPLERLS